MFSHWSRPQLGLATHAVQEVVHRKQNLSTKGCVILYTFRRKLAVSLGVVQLGVVQMGVDCPPGSHPVVICQSIS